ncbi:hypothetical protein, partial [Bacillus thuringiensis]|uniref:hypothetical protein n=1 Tax=Bacillus thuringiensis TaxID=1428 RepID=UPI001C92DC32
IQSIHKQLHPNPNLPLIKPNILNFYHQNKIILLHLKHIHIKYPNYQYKPHNQSPHQQILQQSSFTQLKQQIKKQPIQHINPQNKSLQLQPQFIQ